MPYTISQETLALIPSLEGTKVFEKNKIINVNEDTASIVARNCIIYGSTLEGRQKGSSFLIGSTYKTPIILNDKSNLILIPTHSVRNKKCSWIILKNVLNYYPGINNGVILEFMNLQKLELDNISYSVFDKQVLRATRLESALRGRNGINNKKYL